MQYFGILKAKEEPMVPVRVTCFEVLGEAGIKPWEFFSDFRASMTFMGRKLKSAAHSELADALAKAEQTLIAIAKQQTGNDAITPFEAGTVLGMIGPPSHPQGAQISSLREGPTSATVSMHMFGLAADIEYDFNLFIDPKGTSMKVLDGVLKRARDLFAPDQDPATPIDHPFRFPPTGERKLPQLNEVDAQTEAYFALIDDRPKLEALLNPTRAFPWVETDVDKALERIRKDLREVSKSSRGSNHGPTLEKNLQQNGFIRMPAAIVDNIGLDWGASYGDLHHFDCRNQPKGKKIQKAIATFKANKAKHAALAQIWQPFKGKADSELEVEFAARYPKDFPAASTP
jgi:hypothetical protein